jgi:predicted GNAT family N-acyltransferase
MINNEINYKIIIPSNKIELELYYNLRYEVLRKPWGQPEQTTRDEWENQSLHVLMIDDSRKAIATGRLQFNSETEGQIRSMAVAEQFRGKGLGTKVLKFIEEKAIEKKISKIILDARDNAVNFYLKNGYDIEGDSYLLFDVIPHFRMMKIIEY